ncbi:MAG TPA: guanylate kinase [Chloroflexota bacterium]|nr:guanylate kinase [Chloroflexota bacterium]
MPETVSGLVFVLSGPSGVGKDMLVARLTERNLGLRRVVTAVTRPPRPGEVEGVDYYFLTRERFEQEVARGGFLEWAEYVGSPRGTPLFALVRTLRRGDDAILKIDLDGFRKVKRRLPDVISIFILPPDLAVLERRLRGRGDVPADEVRRRLEQARAELAAADEYDYRVVNRDGQLDRAVDEVAAIVAAERARVPPRRVVIEA